MMTIDKKIHPLNKKFEKVYCINLTERSDRKDKFEKRMLSLGIEFEFFNTIEYGFNRQLLGVLEKYNHDIVYPNEIGCAMSHYHIIKKAKELGLKNVFIFEDDTVFLDTFNEEIGFYLDNLPDDFDLFYLYMMMYKWPKKNSIDYIVNPKKYDKFLYRPKDAHCASAYAINSKMFDDIINYMDKDFRIIDSYYRIIQGLDKYNIYACYPNLTGQDFDRSNIRGNGVNTPKLDYFSNIVTFGEYGRIDYN